MYEREVTIINPTGLHARPAASLVKKAEKYRAELEIQHGNARINPKSIFNVLAAGLSMGLTITVRGSGEDEKEAVDGICELIEGLKE